jgi:hypothetical protein
MFCYIVLVEEYMGIEKRQNILKAILDDYGYYF